MHTRNILWVVAVLCLGNAANAQTTRANLSTTQSYDPSLTDSDRLLAEQEKQMQNAATAPVTLPVDAPTPADARVRDVSSTAATLVPATAPTAVPTTAGIWLVSPVPSSTQLAPQTQSSVIVTSDLDVARSNIAPPLGAAIYSLGQAQIATTPQGENATFQQVLLRAPGVVEDSYGQEHVRGEHANLTYRVNGIILPEGLNAFGQELDTRLIDSVTLIDGSLPAQFGFRTAGIVDVQTKSGATLQSNELTLYGGSNESYQPSVQFGGTQGKLDYFFTGSANHNDLGLENTTDSAQAIHDNTNQQRFFGYTAYRLDDTSRISLLFNASNADFQLPDTTGLPPVNALAGAPNALTRDSRNIDENQNEQQYYAVLAYQKSLDKLSLQAALFTRYGAIHFTPDPSNDLIFQGVAGDVHNTFFTNGAQFDMSYIVNDQHTIRAGLLADFTSERLKTDTDVFVTDPVTGATASDVPESIADNSGNHGVSAGVYLQDEWRVTKKLTLNYGARYDRFDTNFADNGQLSPRVNLVYKLDDKTTFHAGYSRYFVPPPLQYVGTGTINKFINTTNASENFVSGALKVERSNYYDIGVSRQITKPWKINLDGFYKDAHNLVDNGQFGDAVIITPFNYRLGQVYGAELSSTYSVGGFSAFGNFSYVSTLGKDIISQQFLFDNDELAYIHNHYIKLDHEGNYTASIGFSYKWKNDMVYIDALYGSGLRSGFANLDKEPEYFPVNVGYQHIFKLDSSGQHEVKLRLDVLNVFNEGYQIRDGSGVGVAAAQYGARRGFFGGLSYEF